MSFATAASRLHSIVLTPFHQGSIALRPGVPFFSCHVAAQRFANTLREIGDVAFASDTGAGLQEMIRNAISAGRQPVLFACMPPHLLPQHFLSPDGPCPVVIVFPWAYDTIPDEVWGGESRNDWRGVLAQCDGVVTQSRHALDAVQRALALRGAAAVIAAPLPPAFFDSFDAAHVPDLQSHWQLEFNGAAIDSHALGLDRSHHSDTPSFETRDLTLSFSGPVYSLIVDPIDNSKNWLDSLWAFGFAFRDRADVTLIIKLSHYDTQRCCDLLWYEMRKMAPYRCRIVAIAAWLDDAQLLRLIRNSHYVINAARAEGQGHALLEFMAAGKPAICPRHSALADYIATDCAFVIDSSREWIHWPHDPRLMLRTQRYRIDWTTYRNALLRSLECLTQQPQTYRHMAQRAHAVAYEHASHAKAHAQLRDVIDSVLQQRGLPALQRHRDNVLARLWQRWRRQ